MDASRKFVEFALKHDLPPKKRDRVKLLLKEELLDGICTLKEKGYTTKEIVTKLNNFLKSEESAELRDKYQVGKVERGIITQKMVREMLNLCRDRKIQEKAVQEHRQA